MDESSSYGGGGGGKLKKRSLRSRAPSTPYDRPPLAEKKKGGWLSKLFVRPASRILPSLFPSSSSSSSSQHQDQDRDQVQEQYPVEIEQERATVTTPTSNNQNFEPKESDASAEKRQSKVVSRGEGPVGYTFTDLGIAEIERQLQQKKFSRDETNHLIELLRSRTTDLSDDGGHATGLKLEASEVTLGQKDLRKSTKEDYSVQFNLARQQKSSDHFQIAAKDASSSPIEIAKAYMEARTSASSYDFQTGRLKNEKSILCTDNAVSKLSFTPVAKSPMCWPGAVMQNEHGYYTPRRGSVVRHPGTPYSGALFSKSTSKLQANAERPNRSSAAQSSTHVFGRNMSARTNAILDDGVTPFSPIHNIRQKNISHISKGAGPSSPATSFSLLSKSDASRGFSSAIERDSSSKGVFSKFQQADAVDEASRFATAFTPVHPQSSAMARKILEHLDRSVPSPKEKLLEINLARKKLPPKSETPVTDGQHERSDASIFDKPKAGCSLGGDLVSQEILDTQKVLSRKSSNMFSDKDQLSSLTQTSKQGVAQSTTAASSAPFQTPKSLSHSSNEASIPATKSSEKLKIRDNGFSFTFPVPSTPAPFSEPPPTPTMSPPLTTICRTLDAGEASIPSFSFGSDKSSARIVFSFGSAVSSSDTDATTPSFKFESENKSRLSFKTIDKDSICY